MKPNNAPRQGLKKGVLGRILKMLFKFYPVLVPVTIFCIVFSAVASAIPAVFLQKVIAVITEYVSIGGTWEAASAEIIPKVMLLICFYVLSIVSITLYSQLMAYITQGFLYKMRAKMFNGMQDLPIGYFDTHKHGDIMSHYTNDIDTLRQLVSQSLPTLVQCSVIIVSVLAIMLWYSVWLTLIVAAGVVLMTFLSKKIGGGSAKYFIAMQRAIGNQEGYVQETMNGQKVVKVFCHEKECVEEFEKLNNELYESNKKSHAYANALAPILMNIGNVLYVIIAIVGGIFLVSGTPNLAISGLAFSIDIVVPFLNMTKQFSGNVNQLSQQINSIVMGLAGASRIFEMIDEQPEEDNGYVTLVNAKIDKDGNVSETAEHTGQWAWKHPHADGTLTYTPLRGDVRMTDVDFGYTPDKPVLHNISVYAEPGQKVAFVGATGAGKTTITNLINRFYDIADGKIRYDGININKIKKSDLRRSLGIVLQDTNLFSGTVMDNIRYGNLDATDEECIAAAKLAGADGFITRLPDGYATELSNNGANLSQGQRQLIAIARAAVADPPVMILDEATSSIDTRTEQRIQKAFAQMMKGRTSFIVAHRLSTIKEADLILVMRDGKIIEQGTHSELLAKNGFYAELYESQFAH